MPFFYILLPSHYVWQLQDQLEKEPIIIKVYFNRKLQKILFVITINQILKQKELCQEIDTGQDWEYEKRECQVKGIDIGQDREYEQSIRLKGIDTGQGREYAKRVQVKGIDTGSDREYGQRVSG